MTALYPHFEEDGSIRAGSHRIKYRWLLRRVIYIFIWINIKFICYILYINYNNFNFLNMRKCE
ncbi:hypothetical protein EXN48_08110 [Clostridium botulinum]|nr:hypothetical protein AGE31_05880 [Clostridium botulinum]NFC67117.1 hypothetical protein [Clostridium botulinum]NFC99272.1 hypothetical protein [Clostridium botulinum]NFD37258.1 hypothetical protein [Clostridium botulinum]NFD41151.1 hypothetical protein [Clostridium botulinum]